MLKFGNLVAGESFFFDGKDYIKNTNTLATDLNSGNLHKFKSNVRVVKTDMRIEVL